MYVEGEPGNVDDFLYRRLSDEEKRSLTVALSTDGSGEYQGRFDIVLGA
jgi:hypothetical protein